MRSFLDGKNVLLLKKKRKITLFWWEKKNNKIGEGGAKKKWEMKAREKKKYLLVKDKTGRKRCNSRLGCQGRIGRLTSPLDLVLWC